MSKIDDLIEKRCPKGVETKLLAELEDSGIIKLGRGKIISKDEIRKFPGNYPVYSSSSVGDGEIGKYGKYMFDDERITWSIDGGGKFFYRNNLKYSVTNVGGWIKVLDEEYINTKFLYYFLINEWSTKIYDYTKKAHPSVIREEYCIAVPPLEIQHEIVHILDNFTLLSAELSAELKARQKQYDFYLNHLMTFNENEVYYKSVGELFEIKNGLNKEKSAFGKGTPIVNFTDVFNNRWLKKDSFKGLVEVSQEEIERYKVNKGDVFFTRTSETKEEIGMACTIIEDIPNCVFSGFVLRARPTTDLLLPKFCAYYFSTNKVRDTIIRYASFTTRATTTGPKLSKIMVPILSKDKQQEIVDILDNLDKLCNDISEGLPAEIEARKKQYEYYRDKLLTFKELKVEN